MAIIRNANTASYERMIQGCETEIAALREQIAEARREIAAKPALTRDEIEAMTVEEIARLDPAVVNRALAQQEATA
jgi:hypothetical protein